MAGTPASDNKYNMSDEFTFGMTSNWPRGTYTVRLLPHHRNGEPRRCLVIELIFEAGWNPWPTMHARQLNTKCTNLTIFQIPMRG